MIEDTSVQSKQFNRLVDAMIIRRYESGSSDCRSVVNKAGQWEETDPSCEGKASKQTTNKTKQKHTDTVVAERREQATLQQTQKRVTFGKVGRSRIFVVSTFVTVFSRPGKRYVMSPWSVLFLGIGHCIIVSDIFDDWFCAPSACE